MAGDHIDEVFVDIKPDAHGFGRDLDRELSPALHRIEDKFEHLIEALEDGFTRLIAEVQLSSNELASSIDDSMDDIRHDVRRTADAIGVDFTLGTDVAKHAVDDLADSADHDFRRIKRKSRDSGRDTGRGFFAGIFGAISDLGSKLSNSLSGVFSGVGSALSGVGASLGGGGDVTSIIKAAAITALIPAVFGLAGALVHLTGILLALPAVIGVAAAALAPLIIGFKGVGEAIGAGFSGDVKKFDEALKGLAPSARAVVKEIVAFKKPLQDLKKAVQQGLFTELVGEIRPTLAALLPVITKGLTQVATSFSEVFAGVARTLRDPAVLGVLQQLFVVTASIVRTVGPALVGLFRSFFILMGAGFPFVQRMFTGLANGITKFSGYLEQIVKDGRFNKFLENAFNVAKELFGVVGSLGKLIKAIFGGQETADTSAGFIKQISMAIDKLTEFFNSADGKRAIEGLNATVKGLGVVLIGTAIAIGTIVHYVYVFVDAIKSAYHATVDFFGAVGSAIGTAFSAIGSFFSTIGSAIASAASAVGSFIVNIVLWLQALPGRILSAIAAFPGQIRNFFFNALNSAAYAVGFAIGSIIKFFMDLPGRIWGAIQAIPGLVSSVFTTAWNFAKNTTMNAISTIVSFAMSVPGRVRSAIYGLISAIIGVVQTAWNGAKNAVTNGINAVVNLAKSLPGRIKGALSGAGSWLYGVGQDIVRGLGNGISSMLGWVRDKAKEIANSALSGAKRALGIGSPSKEFAKLGVWSARGYGGGFNDEFGRSHGTGDDAMQAIRMPVDMFRHQAKSSGAATAAASAGSKPNFTAYLQINDGQLHPVVITAITEHPQEVALAAENGNSRLARRR